MYKYESKQICTFWGHRSAFTWRIITISFTLSYTTTYI
nr:unnamed protein product [Callosobruchus chinensis]